MIIGYVERFNFISLQKSLSINAFYIEKQYRERLEVSCSRLWPKTNGIDTYKSLNFFGVIFAKVLSFAKEIVNFKSSYTFYHI